MTHDNFLAAAHSTYQSTFHTSPLLRVCSRDFQAFETKHNRMLTGGHDTRPHVSVSRYLIRFRIGGAPYMATISAGGKHQTHRNAVEADEFGIRRQQVFGTGEA